jgi:hypothetical protein
MRAKLLYLVLCLCPALALAEDGDDTLRFYLSRADHDFRPGSRGVKK